MKIEYDQNKREKTLLELGLDFARAGDIFAGIHFTADDNRQDYGKVRHITVGKLDARLVVMVWTQRNYLDEESE